MTIEELAEKLNHLRWFTDDGMNCSDCDVEPCEHFLGAVLPLLKEFAEGVRREAFDYAADAGYALLAPAASPEVRQALADYIRGLRLPPTKEGR